MTTYRDEIEALITTFFYKYYKDYVEPLELEHDKLLDQNKKLKSNDYRDMAIKLKKERDMYKQLYIKEKNGK